VTGLAVIIWGGRAWLLPAGVAVGVLAAALVWAGHRSAAERWVRLGCGLLKLAAVSALALCLLEPLWLRHRALPGANWFALVADNSQSLQIKDSGQSESRGQLLRRLLDGDGSRWENALAETFQVRRYLFDSRLQSTRDFSELDFSGGASALGNALQTLSERWRGQPVAGVLLFTDGNATDLGGDLPALEGCPPIYPVVLGENSGLQDVAVEKVSVSQTAFEDAPVTVQAEVSAQGFEGSSVTARLSEIAVGSLDHGTNRPGAAGLRVAEASNLVATASRRVTGGDAPLNFRFQLQPAGPGLHFYQLEVRAADELANPALPSREATLVNNRRWLVVDRGQEPIRVLYVGGRPNWEFKFLNRAIEDDPQVRMVSLIRVARREPKFVFRGRAGESSNPLFRGFGHEDEETARYDQPVIIRLNTKDEFELRGGFPRTAEELYRYQAVLAGDVEAEFFTHDQMALLQRFVSERGGGFLMLGGAESFREGDYAGTPIASMLPVYLDRPANVKLPSRWKFSLTREGWLQPWTRLRATETEERSRLDSMPPFEVLNPVRDVKPGASVLATVSDPAGQTCPALVVQRFGLGRTAALMVGDLYRWGLRDATAQKDLARSWRQLVRWLVSDVPQRISITAEPAAGGHPAEVRLVVRARNEVFQPLDNATVRLTIHPVRLASTGPGKESVPNFQTNDLEIAAEASGAEPGVYEATYLARAAGAYSVDATVMSPDGKLAGRAAAGWTSDPAAAEFRSLKPNRALLETLARRTGGEVVAARDLNAFVHRLPDRHAPVTEPWNDPLWHRPGVYLFVLCCLLAEWGIRRWKGLP
jgi:uncharacterized membrane protein